MSTRGPGTAYGIKNIYIMFYICLRKMETLKWGAKTYLPPGLNLTLHATGYMCEWNLNRGWILLCLRIILTENSKTVALSMIHDVYIFMYMSSQHCSKMWAVLFTLNNDTTQRHILFIAYSERILLALKCINLHLSWSQQLVTWYYG